MTLLMMPEDDDDESESVREGWLRDTGACVSQDYLSRLAADVTQCVASPGRGWMRWSPVCHLTLTLQTITWHLMTCHMINLTQCA